MVGKDDFQDYATRKQNIEESKRRKAAKKQQRRDSKRRDDESKRVDSYPAHSKNPM